MSASASRRPIDPSDRIPVRDKLAFTSGILAQGTSINTFQQMLTPIYQITLGLNPLWIGALMTVMRIWDAVTDPLVAAWSDNARTRWGRRRPFVFAGAILVGLVFPLLWLPSASWNPLTIGIYMTIASLTFITCHTVFVIPYEALGVEMTEDTNERTRLYAFRGFFPPFMGLAGSWLYAFVQGDFFDGPLQGMRIVGAVLAVLIVLTGILPALLLRERKPAEIERQPRLPLLGSMGKAFRNRAFLCMAAMLFFGQLAATVFSQFTLYAQIYVLYGGNTRSGAMLAGWTSVVHFVVFMASIGIGAHLAQRYSKRAVMFIGTGFTFLAGLSKLVMYNPDYPWLAAFTPLLSAPAGAIGSFIVSAMMADVAFYDQWKTGERREGIYTATASWLYKAALSMSGVLGGALLVAIGFDVSLGGNQPDFTKTWLVLGLVLGGCLPAVISFVALLFYPLSPEVMERCKRDIDERDRRAGIA